MQKLRKVLVGVAGVLGRVLICTVFVAAILGYTAPDVNGLGQTIASKAALVPPWGFVGAVTLLVAGVLSVVVGYKARFGAAALLICMVLATFHGLGLWSLVSSQARHEYIAYLVTNLSIMGAMLFIVANGPGQMSFDGKGR
jgi:putative oxidoreductase